MTSGGISATTRMVTSEWGTPDTFENGLVPEILLGAQYGRQLHFWDLHKRKHLQEIDFGEEHQLVFELRPAHDPTKAYGFVNCVISLKDLSSSIWTWYRDGDKWAVKKIIDDPGRAGRSRRPAAGAEGLQSRAAARHRHRSLDGRQVPLRLVLGHRRPAAIRRLRSDQPEAHRQGQDRRHRRARRASKAPNGPLNGGPQMVEISRDGKRVYFTNSLYGAIDPQFYPDGIEGWMVKLDAEPGGGIAFDEKFFVEWPKGHLPHQVRLEGGDCSSGLLLLSLIRSGASPRAPLG